MGLYLKDGIWFSSENKEISYPDHGNEVCFQVEEKSFWFSYRTKIIKLGLAKSSMKHGDSIIDVGGGNGFVAKALQEMGFSVSLLEPGSGSSNARKRGVKNVYCCQLDDLPADLKFNGVGLFDVLEHIEDPAMFLNQIGKHLDTNSKLFLTVPCYTWLWSSEDAYTGHFRRYNLKTLDEELKRAGFRVSYSTYFFSYLVIPILLLRVIPERLRMLLGLTQDSNVGTGEGLVVGGIPGKIISLSTKLEYLLIRKLGRIGFGASLFVSAEKNESEI